MKKLLLVFLAAFTLGTGLQAQTLENTIWAVSIQGTSVGNFIFADGQISIYSSGLTAPYGNYTLSGNTVTVTYIGGQCTEAGTYTYVITGNTLVFTEVDDPCTERVMFFEGGVWTVSSETGIATHEGIPGLEVFPVPATDQLTLTRPLPGAMMVNIYSMIGELVHQEQVTDMRVEMDLTPLPAGNYILQAATDDGSTARRIVLQ